MSYTGFPGGSAVKNLLASAGDMGLLRQEDPLEKEMATHSSILAGEIPWTGNLVGCTPRDHESWTQLND